MSLIDLVAVQVALQVWEVTQEAIVETGYLPGDDIGISCWTGEVLEKEGVSTAPQL